MTFTVSVIIVTHNRPTYYLNRALSSVLSQTTLPKEIVIVDSGTEEHRSKTKEYLANLAELPVKLTLVGDKIMSAPVARNLGASFCTGNYLGFLDDDDEWYPEKLSSQLGVSTGAPAIIYSPYIEETEENSIKYYWGAASYPDILARNLIGSTSFPLINAEVFQEVNGFDPVFRTNQEWDLWIRILKKYDCVYSHALVGKKYDTGGLSADCISRKEGWKTIFYKHRSEYSKNKKQHKKAVGLFFGEMKRRNNIAGVVMSIVEYFR